MPEPGRTVTALVSADGDLLGSVGPFTVPTPWWADVADVVARLRDLLGVPVVVLRLIDAAGGEGGRGGHVRYHVDAAATPRHGGLDPVPPDAAALVGPAERRAAWASRAGIDAALAWADGALCAAGRPRTGPVEQVRTWNLAALFRLPTAAGQVWLKTLPPFAADEAAIIAALRRVGCPLAPVVVGADHGHRRILLGHAPGRDGREAPDAVIRAAVTGLAVAQAALADRPELIPPGLADRRPGALATQAGVLLASGAVDDLTVDERREADALVARLPALADALAGCGLPETLVHGDCHPGNWRYDRGTVTVLDYADGHLGHPAVDGLRPRAFLPDSRWAPAGDAWVKAWERLRPGSDPARALRLAAPLSDLAYAVRYQEFLDGIETSERAYHVGDPAGMIRCALRSAALAW